MKNLTLTLLILTVAGFAYSQNQCWDDQFVPGNSVNNTVYCVKVDASNDVYVSGTFTTAGGSAANYVAKWNGTAWSALGTGFNGPVYTIEFWGNDIIAGGLFTQAGGTAASNIAVWNGTSWAAMGTGTNGIVRAIKFYDPYVYFGGEFTLANGVTVSNIFRTNGTVWENMNGGVNGPVYSIDIRNFVFTGGKFSLAGSTAVNNVATWNGTVWAALADGLNDTVYTVRFTVTGLYAGGAFTQSGTTICNRVAMFDAGLWKPLGNGFDNSVYTLAISDSLIYAGGLFQNSGTTPVSRIAKYANNLWNPLGSGANASVKSAALLGFDLYCGGAFTQAGNKPSNYFGRYGAYPVVTYQPQNITVCEGEMLEIDLDVWSSEAVTYVWKRDGNVVTAPNLDSLVIDPVNISDAGTYTCEITNIFGTTISANILVTVNALPVIILDPAGATLCQGDSITWQTNATSGLSVVYTWYHNSTPISGITVPELIINGVVPADAGTYYVEATNLCGTDVSPNFTLVVNTLPTVTIGGLNPTYCFTGASDTVVVTPSGGVLSGPNLSGNIFTPYGLVGDHTYSYTYTDVNGCSSTAEYVIHVFNPTPVTISGYEVFYCLAAPGDTIQGSPAGGYFTGALVNDSIFSPAAAGEGTFNISYYFVDTNSCVNGDTVPIVVMQQVAFTYINLDSVLCNNEYPYTITVFPPNGTFTGTGIVNGNQFDPIAAGLGAHTVTYVFDDPWGCSGTDDVTFTVIQGPHATITNLPINVCNNATPFVLNGIPAGGDYEGFGVTDSLFNPSALSPGLTSVFYYVTDSNDCMDTAVVVTQILFVETAFMTGLQPYYCQNELPDTLTGIPVGGDFSGPGVTGNIFSPIDAGAGDHTIMYIYQNPNECLSIDSVDISVFENPDITVGSDTTICEGVSVDITATYDLQNELFWSTGESTATITVQPTHNTPVIATVYDGMCFNADTVEITVNPVPGIDMGDTMSCCNSGQLTAPGGMNGYLWSTNDTDSIINVNTTDYYSCTITNSYGCTNTDSVFAEVLVGPVVELGINRVITTDDVITFVVDQGYDLYLWSDSTTTDYAMTFDGGVEGVGVHTVWIFVQNANGCYDTDTVLVTVNPGIFVESSLYDAQIKLFPNPASAFVNFDLGELRPPDHIRVCDVAGRESQMISINVADVPGSIDISRLASGLYVVHFYFGNTCVTKKLLVK